ncbi:hypothetical protein [Dickeya sp. ws52]|uniref:hypothetical protein n=1 Tax=Dickeya sp. ws52 TaxID=2576377 RepID=UPI001F3C5C4C|nr:hypothetical protein [Dickeya sp. ws52]
MSGRQHDDKKGLGPVIHYLARSPGTGNTVWYGRAILVISPADNQPMVLINHLVAGFSSYQGYLTQHE